MSDKVIIKQAPAEVVRKETGPGREVKSGGIPGPPGPPGPKGEGVLVLSAVEPVPPDTPPNTVIFRRNPE